MTAIHHRYDEAAQPDWFREGRHLAVCPRCDRRAVVEVVKWTGSTYRAERIKLTCEHCGHGEDRS